MESLDIVHGQDVATNQGADDRFENCPMRRLRPGFTLNILLEAVENLLYGKSSGEVIIWQVCETAIEDFLDCVNDLAFHG